MRPSLLDPLFAPITSLPGVGPKLATLIEKIVPADLTDRDARIGDLVFTLPHTIIDRRNRPGIARAAEGAIVTLDVRIDRHQPPPRGNKSVPYRVFAHDDTGEIALTFFHAHAAYLEKALPEGEHVVVSGKMEWFNGRPSMVHPDHIARQGDTDSLPLVEPVYPLTAGLTAKVLRKAVGGALEKLPDLPEWQDADVMRRQTFPSFAEALRRIHNPPDPIDISPENPAWRRLGYDEFLAGQIALALVRAKRAARLGPAAGRRRQNHRKAARGAALFADPQPGAGAGRDQRRPRQTRTHAAAAARRCRLGQDGRRAARHGARRRGRRPGGADGADRNSGAAASGHHRAVGRTRGLARRHPDRPRKGPRPGRHPWRSGGRLDRHRRRHACAVPGERRLPPSGAGRRRRAAPFRRAPAPRDHRQGRCAGHAGDDGDADPAHAGADRFRRHGRVAADRKARRPAADPHRDAAAGAAGRTRAAHAGRGRGRARKSTGSARWSRNPKRSS